MEAIVQGRTIAGTVGVFSLAVAVAGWGGGIDAVTSSHDGSLLEETRLSTVSGVVTFQGTAPTMPTIDMSEEQVCAEVYAEPPRDRAVVVNGNGTLKNVFVYVKEGLDDGATYPQPTDSVWVDQSACRYDPNVMGIRVRQTLAVRNSDATMHNVNATATENRGFNISQPVQGMVSTRSFRRPDVMVELACDVHGWMRAYVGVLPHPFFTTSGDDGSFSIPDLPPGTYTLEAWHAQYGTQTAEVTIGDGDSSVEFVFGG